MACVTGCILNFHNLLQYGCYGCHNVVKHLHATFVHCSVQNLFVSVIIRIQWGSVVPNLIKRKHTLKTWSLLQLFYRLRLKYKSLWFFLFVCFSLENWASEEPRLWIFTLLNLFWIINTFTEIVGDERHQQMGKAQGSWWRHLFYLQTTRKWRNPCGKYEWKWLVF